MSSYSLKKTEHQNAVKTCLEKEDFKNAAYHAAMAAKYGFLLAKNHEGKVGREYYEEANRFLQLSKEFKDHAETTDGGTQKQLNDIESAGDDRWQLKAQPEKTLKDVAGLQSVKKEIKEKFLDAFKHQEIYKRYKLQGRLGLLMYGPAGNGKTYIAEAIAGEGEAVFLYATGADLRDKYVGESEKNIKSLFEEARKHEKTVLFIDEVDDILSQKGEQKVKMVNQFKIETDGIVKNRNNILLLAATNRPWNINVEMLRPNRLGTHVYVGLPDVQARAEIIKGALEGVPLSQDISIEDLANGTEGYSGAELTSICNEGKLIAAQREIATGSESIISGNDMTAAMEKIKPFTTETDLQKFRDWEKERKGRQ